MGEAEKYLIDKKLDKTHWGKIIIEAENRGQFLEEDKRAAGSWVTCACGKLDPRIPRVPSTNEPADDALLHLGELFDFYVKGNSFLDSATTLFQIEARACRIISKMESN